MIEDFTARDEVDRSQPTDRFFEGWNEQPEEKDRPPSKPIILRHIADIVAEQREPEWLIHKVLEVGVLAVLAGPRGTFKSFIALDWAMHMATDNHPGVLLSGEGGGLDRRIAAWMNHHRESVDIKGVPLVALERPVNLNAKDEMKALRKAISSLKEAPQFIVIDTFSKFSAGLDENDNSEVAAFLSVLAELRDHLKCTVLIVAHTGHSDARRPRGASSLMCNPDAEYIVSRPDAGGMIVTVTRERFKDVPSLPPLAYEAKVIDLGRVDRYGEPVTSLALVSTDSPPPKAKSGLGKNQEKGLTAMREWVRTHTEATHITSVELHDLLKNQNVKDRNRRAEVIVFLTTIRVLNPAACGHTVDPEALK